MRSNRIAAAAVALTVAAWCAPAGPATADPTPTPGGPKTTIDKDGTYAVGTDIVPGFYTSAGPVAGGVCYWKRVSGDRIVDNAMTKRPQVVQIEPGDTAFKTDHCQPWHLTDCPPDCPVPQQRPLLPGLWPGLPPG